MIFFVGAYYIRPFYFSKNTYSWEQRKLGDLGKAQSGIGFPDKEQQGKIGIPFYKVSDMNKVGNEIVMNSSNNYVTQQQISKNGWHPISSTPAIIFAKVGAALMLNRKRLVLNGFLIDNNTMAYIFDDSWDNYFGKILFDTIYLPKLSQVGALPSFNGSDLENLEIKRPKSKEEQTAIGNFFKHLDDTITLHQRQTEKYHKLKIGFLESVFCTNLSPNNSKKTNAWEQRKLLDNIISIIDFRGRTPKKLGLDWSESGYLALSALNVKNGYIDPKIDTHFGNEELYQKWMGDKKLRKGQVLFTTEAPMGNVAQVPDNNGYILSQRTIAFEINKKLITDDFLAIILRSPNLSQQLTALSSGGTAKGVSQKSLENVEAKFPTSLAEQTAIGNFFKQLDETIALHQRKIEKYQFIKQLYLEKMFIK